MQVGPFNVNLFSIIWTALSLFMIISGIVDLAKGDVNQKTRTKMEEKYTSESIKAYAKANGLFGIVIGLVFFAIFNFSGKDALYPIIPDQYRWWLIGGLVIVIVVFIILLYTAILKKKPASEQKQVVKEKVEKIADEDMQE